MAEWFKVPLSKSGVPLRAPWVRIPPSPPLTIIVQDCTVSQMNSSESAPETNLPIAAWNNIDLLFKDMHKPGQQSGFNGVDGGRVTLFPNNPEYMRGLKGTIHITPPGDYEAKDVRIIYVGKVEEHIRVTHTTKEALLGIDRSQLKWEEEPPLDETGSQELINIFERMQPKT